MRGSVPEAAAGTGAGMAAILVTLRAGSVALAGFARPPFAFGAFAGAFAGVGALAGGVGRAAGAFLACFFAFIFMVSSFPSVVFVLIGSKQSTALIRSKQK